MRRIVSLFFILTTLPAGAGLKYRSFQPKYVNWYKRGCPSTVKAWRHVRYSMAIDFSNSKVSRAPFNKGREKGAWLANRWLNRCLSKPRIIDLMDSNPLLAGCLQPIERYLKYYRTTFSGHAGKRGIAKLGFKVDDRRYNKESIKRTPIPEELTTNRFLTYLNRLETLPDAFKYLHRQNQKRKERKFPPFEFLFFESHLPTEDRAKSRAKLLVFAPAAYQSPDMYFLFGLPNEKNRASDETSSISVGKDGAFFYQFWRRRRNRVFGLERYRELKTGNCVACHKSGGPLAIHPTKPSKAYKEVYDAYSFWVDETEKIPELNRKILTHGQTFSKYHPRIKGGVGIGAVSNRFRNEEFFRACTKGKIRKVLNRLPASAREVERVTIHRRLERSMDCARCHNGKIRTRIHPPFELALTHFVENGHMPPDNDLRPFERKMLKTCLAQEFWGHHTEDTFWPGTLFDYLTADKCANDEKRPRKKAFVPPDEEVN